MEFASVQAGACGQGHHAGWGAYPIRGKSDKTGSPSRHRVPVRYFFRLSVSRAMLAPAGDLNSVGRSLPNTLTHRRSSSPFSS